MATKVIFSMVLFALTLVGHSQSIFYKTYGGNGYDTGNDVIQLETDSSFYIAGSSSSVSDAPSQAMLLHVDKHGEFLASYFYGGPLSDVGVRVMHKPGVGFWIAGYSNSFSNDANFDFYLIKLNEDYEMVWQKTYGTANWERLHDAILLPDEGVLLVGEVEGLGHSGKDGYAIRTNADGDLVWEETYSGPDDDVIYSCALRDNNSYVVAGKWGTEYADAWAACFDFDGTVIWSKNDYSEDGNRGEYREVRVTPNYIYCVGNWTPPPYAPNTYQPYRTQMFLNGDLFFNRYHYSIAESHVSMSVVQQDEIYLTTESRNVDFVGENGPRCGIFRYNEYLGQPPQYIGFMVYGAKVHAKRMILPLDNDGRVALVGYTEDGGISSGGSNVFFLRIDSTVTSLETVVQHQILSIETPPNIEFSVYPNPSNGVFYLNAQQDLIIRKTELFDNLGRKVFAAGALSPMDFSGFSSGLYYLKLETNLGEITATLSIQ